MPDGPKCFNYFVCLLDTSWSQCGAFKEYVNAKRISDKINSIGYSNCISKINDYHKVYVGPFKNYETASEVSANLNKNKIDNYVLLNN